MFYLLSLITGILECGWIAYGAVHSLPLYKILCYPLAYHLGNLFPKPFSLNRKILYMMSLICLADSCIMLFDLLPDTADFILTFITLLMLSAVIQSVRSGLKTDGNRLIKRVFRVCGFALAPSAAVCPETVLIIVTVIAFIGLRYYNGDYGISIMNAQNGYSLVMLFHQLHYFFYAHITLSAVSLWLLEKSSAGHILASLLFCGTWVTYMSVEPIVSKFTSKITLVFYAGHAAISVLLIVMCSFISKPFFIWLWLITGFGGGVVYTISARAKSTGSFHKDSMTVSENIGHTAGLVSAVIVSYAAGESSPYIMLTLGSLSAFLTIVSMTCIISKEKKT